MSPLRAYLSLTFAAILWGANFNLAKPVLVEMSPLPAGAWRYLIAAAVAVAILFAGGGGLAARHIKVYALLALFGVVGYNAFFFLALQNSSAINASLIMALNPLLTIIVAYFVLGDRPRRAQLLAIPIGLSGVAVVILGAGSHKNLARGDLLMLVASLMWALYSVYVRKSMPRDASSTANIAGIMLVGAVGLTLLSLASGTGLPLPSRNVGIELTILALGGGLVAYFLWNAGVATVGAGAAALFINLVPVTSMVIASVFGSPPTMVQLMGGVVVVGAVLLSAARPGVNLPDDPNAVISNDLPSNPKKFAGTIGNKFQLRGH